MTNFRRAIQLCKKIIFNSGEYTIYSFDSSRKIYYEYDSEIKKYSEYEEIPEHVKNELFRLSLLNPLYYRIKLKQAVLLCFHSETQVISFGWIQSWKPFKKKFGWLFKNATMLGPFWTNPQYRGEGYYGRLLKHCIVLSNRNLPILIYAAPENISSKKGIEKLNFKKIGDYRINVIFGIFRWQYKLKSYN
jgi:hypothetical protein